MEIEQLAELLKTGPAKLKSAICGLETKSETADQKAIHQALARYSQGWLHCHDGIVSCHEGQWYNRQRRKIQDITAKHVFYGEMNQGKKSLHIRKTQTGWNLIEFQEGEGRAFLVQDFRFKGQHGRPDLFYRRYWGQDPNWGYSVKYARFNGFEGDLT